MSTSQVLYERVKELVEQKGVSINQMLRSCGLNPSLMTDVKNKGTIPSAEKIAKMADYLEVSVDYLLGRSEVTYLAANASGAEYHKLSRENKEKLDELAKHLYEKETITGDEFMSILNG